MRRLPAVLVRGPVVTHAIIALCAASYVLQLTLGWSGWTQHLAFSPAAGEVEPYRFLSAAFVHADQLPHILLNMFALYQVGPFLESFLGRLRFVLLYVLSAVGGSVAVVAFADPALPSWRTAVVGASGAVFGLYGAALLVLRRFGSKATQLMGLLAVNFAIGFLIPAISWQSHVGGFATGAMAAAGTVYATGPRRGRWSLLWFAGVAAVLATLTFWVYRSMG